jgi:hypothetical protein
MMPNGWMIQASSARQQKRRASGAPQISDIGLFNEW